MKKSYTFSSGGFTNRYDENDGKFLALILREAQSGNMNAAKLVMDYRIKEVEIPEPTWFEKVLSFIFG